MQEMEIFSMTKDQDLDACGLRTSETTILRVC